MTTSIIKDNIIKLYGEDIGASCIDMYLVGFVSEEYVSTRTNVRILFEELEIIIV